MITWIILSNYSREWGVNIERENATADHLFSLCEIDNTPLVTIFPVVNACYRSEKIFFDPRYRLKGVYLGDYEKHLKSIIWKDQRMMDFAPLIEYDIVYNAVEFILS